jgi:hypothetical protein
LSCGDTGRGFAWGPPGTAASRCPARIVRRGGALYRELIEADMTEDELEVSLWFVELDEIEDEKPCLE